MGLCLAEVVDVVYRGEGAPRAFQLNADRAGGGDGAWRRPALAIEEFSKEESSRIGILKAVAQVCHGKRACRPLLYAKQGTPHSDAESRILAGRRLFPTRLRSKGSESHVLPLGPSVSRLQPGTPPRTKPFAASEG